MKQMTKPKNPAWCRVTIRVITRKVLYVFKHLTEANVSLTKNEKLYLGWINSLSPKQCIWRPMLQITRHSNLVTGKWTCWKPRMSDLLLLLLFLLLSLSSSIDNMQRAKNFAVMYRAYAERGYAALHDSGYRVFHPTSCTHSTWRQSHRAFVCPCR
jgi:hypothetical protein